MYGSPSGVGPRSSLSLFLVCLVLRGAHGASFPSFSSYVLHVHFNFHPPSLSLSLNSSAHAAVPCATCSRSLTHRRYLEGLDSDPSGGCHACAAAMGLGGRHGCRRSALLLADVQGDVSSTQTPHVGASPGQTPGAPCLGMPCPRCPPLEHKVAAGRPRRFFFGGGVGLSGGEGRS